MCCGETRYRPPVALTPEAEWTLIACGLVALADGALREGEAGRVLAAANEALTPAEQDAWSDRLRSREALLAHVGSVPQPRPEAREGLLRRAWSIALAEGEGSVDEARALEQVGERLRLDREQVALWRKQWTSEAAETAVHLAGFAALLLHRRAAAASSPAPALAPPDRAQFEQLLARMPLSDVRRQRLHRHMDTSPTVEELGNGLLWLSSEQREEVLHELVGFIRGGNHGELGQQLFLALADRMAVTEDAARAYLEA